jgi:hypothetical protein
MGRGLAGQPVPISFTENGTDPFSYPQEGWENRAVTEGKFLHSARQGSRALDFTKTGQEPVLFCNTHLAVRTSGVAKGLDGCAGSHLPLAVRSAQHLGRRCTPLLRACRPRSPPVATKVTCEACVYRTLRVS